MYNIVYIYIVYNHASFTCVVESKLIIFQFIVNMDMVL